MSDPAARRAAVRAALDRACDAAGRDPASVTLVCVSKTHPAAAVRALHALGERDFGESYAQEWLEKAEDPSLLPLADLRWSFVGHLQRNKARLLVGRVHLVESVDSARLARELSRLASARGPSYRLPVLLQANLAGESSKGGLGPEELMDALPALAALPGLLVRGLMHIPPPRDDEGAARGDHAALRRLRDALQDRHGLALPELSMGMSADFAAAIAEGATRVRVGTALFGPR